MRVDISGKGQTSSLLPLLRGEGPTTALPHSHRRGPGLVCDDLTGEWGLWNKCKFGGGSWPTPRTLMEPPEMSLRGLTSIQSLGKSFMAWVVFPAHFGPSHCRTNAVQHHDLCSTPDHVEGKAK